MRPYYTRIGLASLGLMILLSLALWLGPRAAPLTLVAQTPNGAAVAVGAPIRASFARPVDRRSAESNFRIEPFVPGRFFWQDTILTYEPLQPLAPETAYRVTILAGLRDAQGRTTTQDLSWEFQTRGSRLLALRPTPAGGSALWLIRPDGTDATQVYTTPESIRSLLVAPNGMQALIVEARGSARAVLVLVDLEDGSTRLLVDEAQASVAAPDWSAVGDFVVFERRALNNPLPQLWLGQPDGTLLGPLYSGEQAQSAVAPVWSPDGNRVAFRAGEAQLLTVYDFFTDMPRSLGVTSGGRVAWLPDSSGLIASVITPAREPRLVRVPYPAGEPQDLTDGSVAAVHPALSPDGTQVAFVQTASANAAGALWLVATDGAVARQVSSQVDPNIGPLWAPDGTQLAFIRASAVVLLDVATGAEQVVFNDATQVVWAP